MAYAPPTVSAAAQALPRRRARSLVGAPRLSVLIVNYRQWEKTEELVRELIASAALRTGQIEVVIVDNHSPAHPFAKKLRRLPGVSLRRWERNHGFARAVNEGCRLSRGDWFLLLNPDMTLSEGFADSVLELAERVTTTDPHAGIIGFHLRNSDGSQQLSSGPFPTLTSTLLRLALPRKQRKYQSTRSLERCRVPWVTGCCLLMRRKCLEELAGLDEDYFLYYEDVDLCLRAWQHGWTVWFEPNLAVVHHHPLQSRAVPAALRMVTRHSLLTYGSKHWPRWQSHLLARIVRLESWIRRSWAWWRGDPHQATLFRELSAMAGEIRRGEHQAARRRLDRAVQKIDVRVGV